jgi:pimeloyl-ACP methyl ester carboxylesterase
MKFLWWLIVTLVLVLGSLYAMGLFLTSRLETVLRPTSPLGPGASFLATRSGRVHVLDVGKGEVVLLLHGSGRSIADWQEGLASRLSEQYRVVAFDNYGFGMSDRNHPLEYGNSLWAAQAVDVLDALEIERVAVLGHSAGGVVAATLAADHPDRIRGAIFVGHGLAMDPVQLLPFIPGIGEMQLSQTSAFGETFSDLHRQRIEAAYRIRGTRSAYLTFVRRQFTVDSLRLVTGTYEDIRLPVLQIHGSLDASIPIQAARKLSTRLDDVRFVEIEGSGHNVHIDAPDQLAAEVANFVAILPP